MTRPRGGPWEGTEHSREESIAEVRVWASSPPVTCRPDTPIQAIARMMAEHHVGAVVVVDCDRRPVGIVTDRDLALRGLARNQPPYAGARAVMSPAVVVIEDDRPLDEASDLMTSAHVRRLPVVNRAGVLIGVLSKDDIELAMTS